MKITKIVASGAIEIPKLVQPVIYKKGYSPFVQNGTWWQYDELSKGYVDTRIVAEGKDFKYEDFTDEQLEKLKPVIEVEKVNGTTAISIDGVHKADVTDGYTPVKEVDYFTKEEQESFKKDIPPQKGIDYKDGVDGHSPIVTASKVEDTTSVLVDGNTIATIKDGYTPQKGVDYEDGYTPVKGTDYFTSKEIEDFKKEVTPKKDIDYRDGIDGKDGIDGVTPVKGVDYFTSKEISDIESDIRKYIPSNISAFKNDCEYISSKPLMSMTHEHIWNASPTYSGSSSQKHCGWFFFRIKPIDKSKNFAIKCGVKAWMPDWTKENLTAQGLTPANYGGGGENYLFGRQEVELQMSFTPVNNKSYTKYIVDCDIPFTSYRPLYYMLLAYPKSQTQDDDWYYFGWSIYNSYQFYASSQSTFEKLKACFGRTIITDIYELENCEIESLNELIAYDNTLLPQHTFIQPTIATNGRTQIGDANSIDRDCIPMYKTADGALTAYAFVMQTEDPGKVGQVMTNTSNSTAQTKEFSSRRFNISKGIYFYASSAVKTNGAALGGTSMYTLYPSCDLRYAFNCGNNILSNKPGVDVYLVGAIESDGFFVPHQFERVVNGKTYKDCLADETMLPTEADGLVYILLGHTATVSRYSIVFLPKHPVYKHNGTYMECIGTV